MKEGALDRLRAASHGLHEIRQLASDGRAVFDKSLDRQRSLAYVWITVGSALKDYATSEEIPQGEPPFGAVIRYRDRLAHQALDRLDVEIVWETTENRALPLLLVVEQMLSSAG